MGNGDGRVALQREFDRYTGIIMPKKPVDPRRLAYGGQLAAGMAAASFAAILTLVGLQRQDPAAQRAMIAFCIVIPVMLAHRLMTVETDLVYRGSCLIQAMIFLGFISFFTGTAMLVATVSPSAAAVLIGVGIAMGLVTDQAERRGRKRAAKEAAAESAITSDSSHPNNTP